MHVLYPTKAYCKAVNVMRIILETQVTEFSHVVITGTIPQVSYSQESLSLSPSEIIILDI